MSEREPRTPWVRRFVVRPIAHAVNFLADGLFLALAVPLALVSRLSRRPVDVGMGPEPLINNVYHKKALALHGYTAETFVDQVYFITSEFDVRADLSWPAPLRLLRAYGLFIRSVFRYKAMYLYFNGGPLMTRPWVWRLEPWLYRLARVHVVVMPYGADVQDMSRSRSLAFKDAMARDYPLQHLRRRRVVAQIDLWTQGASHVISGVEWVDYMIRWDTLMLGHFSIDIGQWRPVTADRPSAGPLRVLHAPNHRAIKGSDHFERAVDELRAEGVDVELVLLQGVPNDQIREVMGSVDVVADQLIVGWYAMFALEAMAMGKAVMCYLREDLVGLYESVGLVAPGEIPLVNCDPMTVKATIRHLAENRHELVELGERGRRYVEDHHSLEYVGSVFAAINRDMGLDPSRPQTV